MSGVHLLGGSIESSPHSFCLISVLLNFCFVWIALNVAYRRKPEISNFNFVHALD